MPRFLASIRRTAIRYVRCVISGYSLTTLCSSGSRCSEISIYRRYKSPDVHAVIVGRLGMHQLGAVGLSNMVFFFVTVFFSFLLVVTTPRVADALAVDNRSQVQPLFLAI